MSSSPAALPDILTGIRTGLGVGWSTLLATELIAATRGLEFMVQSARKFWSRMWLPWAFWRNLGDRALISPSAWHYSTETISK